MVNILFPEPNVPLVQVITPLRVPLPKKLAPARTVLELIRFPLKAKLPLLKARVAPAAALKNPLPLSLPLRLMVPVWASTVPVVMKVPVILLVPVPPDLRTVPSLKNPWLQLSIPTETSAVRSTSAPGKLMNLPYCPPPQ